MFSSNEIEANRIAEIRDKTIQLQYDKTQSIDSGRTDWSMFKVRHQGIVEHNIISYFTINDRRRNE